jgi:NAD(P)H-flavin reductase
VDDLFLPRLGVIRSLRDETRDTRSFALAFRDPGDQDRFRFRPGQFIELSVFGFGEAPFCLASGPGRTGSFLTTVRRVGTLTDALHRLRDGDEVGIRGPFGNGFDLPAAYGKDLLFVAGGIGLPPLRGLLEAALDERGRFGRMTLLYGARTPEDIVYREELRDWAARDDLDVCLTVDSAGPAWKGNVGVVTALFRRIELRPATTVAYVCGPPIMIGFVLQELTARGFDDDSVISTLERMMQCGVGKCNHCAIRHRYVCRDGPVFSRRQMRELVE